MSNPELEAAKLQLQESTERFEKAAERIRNQIDQGIDLMQKPGNAIKGELNSVFNQTLHETMASTETFFDEALSTVDDFLKDVKKSAEDTLQAMDKKPLVSWIAVFGSGLFLGATLARITREKQIDKKSAG